MLPNHLLIASNNPDKIAEIRSLLGGLKLEIYSLTDFPELPPTVEDQPTIQGNAMKKALEAAQATGMLCLADDTGFFIDALDGAPGVFAARFAGEGCSYKDNRDKVLEALQDKDQRTAEFRTCCALAAPDGIAALTEGVMPGSIAYEELGENGFGYDSIFLPQGFEITYAQMSDEHKNSISHRAKALHKMLPLLKDIISSL